MGVSPGGGRHRPPQAGGTRVTPTYGVPRRPHEPPGLRLSLARTEARVGRIDPSAGGGNHALQHHDQGLQELPERHARIVATDSPDRRERIGQEHAIEALRLLSWVAQGNRLDSNLFITNGYRRLRGEPAQLGYQGATHFSFGCETTHPDWDRYSITLSSLGGGVRITNEWLGGSRQVAPLMAVQYRDEPIERELQVGLKGERAADPPLEVSFSDQVAGLVQAQNLPRLGRGPGFDAALRDVAAQYEAWISSFVFLDAHPASMRQYASKGDRRLASDGSNLSGVLYNLCRNANVKAEMLQLVRTLPEQVIQDIGFIETPRDEVMAQLTESFGGVTTEVDVTLLSDGTLRVLAAAAAVLSAPEGSVVVVEELDAGVHPSRARKLLRDLTAAAGHRNVRILTTTHDPALLDAVPDEALGDMIFCYRDPENGSSNLVRLRELRRYPELIAQGPVGHLLTRGVIDRLIKDQTSPEERKQRALDWLQDLRTKTG